MALAVGVAETVVYAAYLQKMDRARSKERSIVERKELIGEVLGDNETGKVNEGCVRVGKRERVEIWGKGINGGARRRIRERWERGEREKNLAEQ